MEEKQNTGFRERFGFDSILEAFELPPDDSLTPELFEWLDKQFDRLLMPAKIERG